MMRFAIALVACAVVGCGGDGGEERTLESFVDPSLLEQVENEHQRLCLLNASIAHERSKECGIEVGSSDGFSNCLLLDMPVGDGLKAHSECFDSWANGECAALYGAADDPCALVIE